MIFEMRQYVIARGRMSDNHDRMLNHLPALLSRHNIRVVGRWTAVAGPKLPMFCYIMEWRDFAEREACWASFYADEEWARIRSETNAGSELVESYELAFLKPNPAWSPKASDASREIGGVHQMIVQQTLIGHAGAVNSFLAETWLPCVVGAGAHVIGLCDMVSGPGMPNIVILLAWADERAYWTGWRGMDRNEMIQEASRHQRSRYGTTLFGVSESALLEPLAGALPFASLGQQGR